jgi:putative addiction module component (TIGR02574 family)
MDSQIPSNFELPASVKEELARRKANLQKNPSSALSWEEIQRRMRSRGMRFEADKQEEKEKEED